MNLEIIEFQDKRKKVAPNSPQPEMPNGKAVVESEVEEHGDSTLVRSGRFALFCIYVVHFLIYVAQCTLTKIQLTT